MCLPSASTSVLVPRAVVLRADHQTPALLGAPVHRLDNVDKLLLILKHPVELVVVARAKITHDVFVAEEEHDGARVVQLVHGIEVGDLERVRERFVLLETIERVRT